MSNEQLESCIAPEQEVPLPPVHFEYISLRLKGQSKPEIIKEWILTFIHNRFYIVDKHVCLEDNAFVNSCLVGFEDPKDLSFFLMACPHLE